MSFLANWTMDMWSPIINLFDFIPNYGFMIIVFTIVLKLILSPLDIWQRKVSRDSMRKQQKMQPELQKLKKQYQNNPQALNQKTMQLYKKEGYNVVGSCLSMLINLILTAFIFITLFTGLVGISQEKIYNQYTQLETVYQQTLITELQMNNYDEVTQYIQGLIDNRLTEAEEALVAEGVQEPNETQIRQKAYELVAQNDLATEIDIAQANVAEKYEEIKDNWLWIDSVWRPDTYVSGVPNYNDFYNIANLNDAVGQNEARLNQIAMEYNTITADIQKTYSSWNGYFILVVLSGAITFFSLWLNQKSTTAKNNQIVVKPVNNSVKQNNQQPEANTNTAMKIMKFVMPVIMIIFTFSYSAAFALYIVTNSLMGVIINFTCMKVFDKLDKKKDEKEKETKKVSYSR